MRLLVLATVAVSLATSASAALTVDAALSLFDKDVRGYNLVSFGAATFGSGYGDTEGALAVAGNLSLAGGAIGTHVGTSSDPVLLVGGALSVTGEAYLNRGHASLNAAANAGWQWDATQARLTRNGAVFSTINSPSPLADVDPRTNTGIAGWDFAAVRTDMIAISKTLAEAPVTGSIVIKSNQFKFVAPTGSHGVIVFNLDASKLGVNTYGGAYWDNVQFDVPTGDVFVVNVSNAKNNTTLFGGGNFNAGSGYNRLLWNFVDGTPLDANDQLYLGNGGQFFGAVLAPTWNVSNIAPTAINGQVVAGGFATSGAELHFTSFDYEVPEPSTYGLLGAGLCACLAFWRRRCARG